MAVRAGTSVAVTGPSGCGKSTFLGIVGGLDVPTSGQVLIDDQPLAGARGRARWRRADVGFIFQEDDLVPHLTALENITHQLALSGRTTAADRQRGAGLLEALGMADHADRLPDHLSGGQRQRIAVVRALAPGPRLILADEPTGSVDAAHADVILRLLMLAERRAQATLLLVTHDPDVASSLDRQLVLADGRLVGDSGDRPGSAGAAAGTTS